MSELQMVHGNDCLAYIERPIGFSACDFGGRSTRAVINDNAFNCKLLGNSHNARIEANYEMRTYTEKIPHDISKRKIGLILDEYDDGGLYVAILGNETIETTKIENYGHRMPGGINCSYEYNLSDGVVRKGGYNGLPLTDLAGDYVNNSCYGHIFLTLGNQYLVSFDEMIDYVPEFNIGCNSQRSLYEHPWTFTNNLNNTMRFGIGEKNISTLAWGYSIFNPLRYVAGNLYSAVTVLDGSIVGNCPLNFPGGWEQLDAFSFDLGTTIESTNQCAIPFNLILTHSEQYAQAYLNSGTVPPDAYLYPLDWNNLPQFDDSEEINPDDVPNNNTPGDDNRDVTPNPPVVPSFTPSQFSNYNWYWLTVGEYADFIRWFWYDVGMSTSFDSIIAKIEGLYNNLSSAVIMARYYPVDISWIGGEGTTENIKLGMIEKSGNYTTISQAHPPTVRKIAHKKIPTKYDSFMDLSPYSQLSLYLPFHGFVDLDINILSGHSIDIYGVYDYLTGTLQYFIYYDDSALINTFVVKLAVDIPLTLQTKNDRDSSAFQNVSSVIGGLIGAGAGVLSGNPIGIAMGATQGVQAFNSANASAPLNVRGTVGETGALYAPPQCAIILRRPTIQPSDKGNRLTTWIEDVGQLCGYGCKLSGLSGYTQCAEPRINFTKTTPLQSEVEEIYNYLKEGVIL